MLNTWLIALSEPLLLALLVLFSTLAYQYLDALRMLRRQAFLSHVYRPEGVVRRWFWDSLWLRIWYSIAALAGATIALVFMSQIGVLEAYVLALGTITLLLVYRLVFRLLQNETQPQFQALISLRISAWVNLGLMAITLVLLQITWLEVPDTRYLSFSAVTASAWQVHTAEAAGVSVLHWLFAGAAVAHEVSWHLMQQASRVDAAIHIKLLAWFLLLLVNAFKLGSLQLLLLGLMSIAVQVRQQGWGKARQQLVRPSYWLTLLFCLVVYVLLSRGYGWLSRSEVAQDIPLASHTQIADPCAGELRQQQQEAASAQVSARLSAQQQAAAERIERYVTEVVQRAFRQAESGVDAFLDWNFSISGQYQQLAYLAAHTAGSGFTDGSARFSGYLSEQMNAYISAPLTPALVAAQADIQQIFMAELHSSGMAYQRLVQQVAAESTCMKPINVSFQPSQYIDKSLVGLGVAGGAIALRFATAAGSRAASRAGMRRVIAALFTRGAARAGAVGSGSAGALCGPAFWLCTPVIIAGTWLSIDFGLNKADEVLNRERMRAEMLASLAADSEAAAAELAAFYQHALVQFYAELEANQQRQFNIRRDGL